MRLIKLALISAVFLFGLATLISLAIPSQVRISRAANIYGSPDSVLSLLGDRQRWPLWNPPFMAGDSAAPFEPVKVVSQVQTDSSIILTLQQGGKKPIVTGWNVYRFPGADSVAVQWYMDFKSEWYPWQKFGSLVYDNIYGGMMEQGLTNLKKLRSAE